MTSRIRFVLACSVAALIQSPLNAQQPGSTPAKAQPAPKASENAGAAAKPVERKEPNRGGEIDLASQDPAVAQQRFTIQEGYEVNLFASEKEFPELAKPVAFTFDDRGRLWVATMPSYPHYLPGEAPRDKIIILEDTDNDGKADKSTTFADDLYLPTGFELGDGGVYVGQQPFVAFLKDTDGDGKADKKDYLLHGFGTEDSHHAVHAFQWGPDGGLYFHEGIFHNTQVETPYGRVQLKDAGAFRFDPFRQHFSIFVSYGFANPWGHIWDRWGSNFIADASGGSNYFGSAISGDLDFPYKHPNMKVFTTVVRPTAGCEIVASRHFPESAQGNFLVNNCIGFQGIKQHQVIEEGSGYTSKEVEPLLQSSDPNFRPVALSFGPDGALYLVDWWNPLIGHMQYSLRDPRRDKAHGRVWRITAKNRPLVPKPKIHGATIAQKLDLLKEYEDRTRYRARISLREHPAADVKAEIAKWVPGLDKTHKDYEHHLLEALWASQTIGEPDAGLLKTVLAAKEPNVRSGATRALRFFLERASGERSLTNEVALDLLAKQITDPAPRVRLEALLTLSFIRQPEAAAIAIEALRQETDYYLDYVLQETITTLEPNWKPVLLSGKELAKQDNPKGTDYLLARLSIADLVRLAKNSESKQVHTAVLTRGGIGKADRSSSLEAFAKLTSTTPLNALVGILDQASGDARKELVQMLVDWPTAELGAVRDRIEKLAAGDPDAGIRQAGWVALMRADGSPEKAWTLASQDQARLADLLDSTALLKDEKLLGALYPKVQPLLTANATGESRQPVLGRFVRIEHPARSRTLTLAEVQVFSGGENIAPKGKATQSSVAFGGVPDRAIDGRTDGNYSAGTSSHTIEMEEFPWWEVDLGGEKDLDKIVVWNRTDGTYASRLNNFQVSVLDAQRKVVWSRSAIPTSTPSVTLAFTSSSDPNAAVRRSALAALSRIPGHDAQTFQALAHLILADKDVPTAVAAIHRLPKANWPKPEDDKLVGALMEQARRTPAQKRDNPAYRQLIDLGATIARKAGPSMESAAREMEAFLPQAFTIKTIEAQMKFDVTRFYVEAGRPVRITLENPDVMQHNLVVMQPGAREEVGKQADAMGADGFKAQFIPKNDKILFATKLVDPKKSEPLDFAAPEKPGDYEFVCTFPGHWLLMWGTMTVVPRGDPRAGRIETAATAGEVRPGNF